MVRVNVMLFDEQLESLTPRLRELFTEQEQQRQELKLQHQQERVSAGRQTTLRPTQINQSCATSNLRPNA
jgi:hypothetical protein